MAGERTLPGLGLTGFWDLGDNTWKTGNDANLRLLSVLVQGSVLSVQATEPGTPADGEIYISSGTWGGSTANDIVVRDDAAWVPITPQEGWEVFNKATGKKLRFNGTAWITPGSMDLVTDGAADRVVSNADLAGNRIIERSNASAQTVTVNAGLTGTEPVTFIKTGAGDLTFVAGGGVTINSAGGVLAVGTTYASVTLIPKGGDVYHLIGGLDAPA
jgi:hypothetical protein